MISAEQKEFIRQHGTRLPKPVGVAEISQFIRGDGQVTKCPPTPETRMSWGARIFVHKRTHAPELVEEDALEHLYIFGSHFETPVNGCINRPRGKKK